MALNIFSDIKELVRNLLAKFSWENVMILLAGIAIGFVMCAFIYLVVILVSLKKSEDYIHKAKVEIEDEEIKRVIRSARNLFYEESSNQTTAQKFVDLKSISWQLINDIAKMYYPNSEYPIYELSLDELMMLNHYITNRVDSLFKGKILRSFKKVKISQILRLIDIKKKIDDNKVVKVAKKAKVPGLFKATMTVLNVFNPAYWVKKLMINTTLSVGSNKIAATIIDIVGEETAKIYSKNVFNKEKVIESDVEKTIKEIEQGLENGNI
jgi:hypothetical protein